MIKAELWMTVSPFRVALRKLAYEYTEIFSAVKIENFIRKKKMISFTLFLKKLTTEAVLTTTHNLCFRSKISKIGMRLHTLYKSGG